MQEVLSPSLPLTLQRVRKARRLSQLELSLRMGISQRHLSFVESGRARPSRELLMNWLQELQAPLALRNATLLQAGFAPVYGEAELNDQSLSQARHAIEALLHAHEPMPALVMDAQWNILHINTGAKWLMQVLMPQALSSKGTPNMLQLLCHPEGLLKHLVNLAEVAPSFLAHLREEASVNAALTPRVDALTALLQQRLGAHALTLQATATKLPPLLTSRFATTYGELAFFSMFTTFGTPQDITLASLRIEHMFAANAATGDVLQREVPSGTVSS